jgi:ligand-binding SRPBCC domain-containing protein
MVRIELVTNIAAPIERCFDLSRSIDLHMASTDWTGERAIAGVTSGLIGLDQTVTWQGRHFGFKIQHTSQITAFDRPRHFQDSMVRGIFRSFCHDHYFENASGETRMKVSWCSQRLSGCWAVWSRARWIVTCGRCWIAGIAALSGRQSLRSGGSSYWAKYHEYSRGTGK